MNDTTTDDAPVTALWASLAFFAALMGALFVTDLRVLGWAGVLFLGLSAPLMALWRRNETGVAGPEPSEAHPRGS